MIARRGRGHLEHGRVREERELRAHEREKERERRRHEREEERARGQCFRWRGVLQPSPARKEATLRRANVYYRRGLVGGSANFQYGWEDTTF